MHACNANLCVCIQSWSLGIQVWCFGHRELCRDYQQLCVGHQNLVLVVFMYTAVAGALVCREKESDKHITVAPVKLQK